MHPTHPVDTLTRKIRNILFTSRASRDAPITEQELADCFQFSRTPIRAALRVLEEEGLIERRKRKGIYLRRAAIKELAEVYEVRAVLEGFAGRLAVRNATRNDIKELQSWARRFTRARERRDFERAERANVAFHNKIVELAGNTLLENIMERFAIVRRAFRLTHTVPAESGAFQRGKLPGSTGYLWVKPCPRKPVKRFAGLQEGGGNLPSSTARRQWALRDGNAG